MVEIYLNIHRSQAPFLSIPDSDVQRLSKSPFKWLRYVMFSICGAPGDLSVMPDGPPVDYGTTLLPCKNLPNSIYYYNPSGRVFWSIGDWHLVLTTVQQIVSLWTMKDLMKNLLKK
jgi:hypothetical protein